MDLPYEHLGEEVQDANEETFDLFSHASSSQDLGMVDPKAEQLDISIAGRDFTIKQSPGILRSNREGGTTGAAVWRLSVALAEWLGSSKNFLFGKEILHSRSVVLELGSGISGLVPSVLSPRLQRVVATDQRYALKLLQENIVSNLPQQVINKTDRGSKTGNIDIQELDWETDDIAGFHRAHNLQGGVDALIICDCVFNYALISPLVETCVEICRARQNKETPSETQASQSTFCIIAQQLRQPDVFEQWLETFLKEFKTWRVPSDMLSEGLKEGSGFVVHIGLLR